MSDNRHGSDLSQNSRGKFALLPTPDASNPRRLSLTSGQSEQSDGLLASRRQSEQSDRGSTVSIADRRGSDFSVTSRASELSNRSKHSQISRVSSASQPGKKRLTVILDGEKAVTSRFDVVLVAENALEFAQLVIGSEMAEANKPNGGPGKQLSVPESVAEEPSDNAHSPLVSPVPSVSALEVTSGAGDEEKKNLKLVMHCPLHYGSQDLARMAFRPVVGFSQELPRPSSENKTVVVFLFWRVPEEESEGGGYCTESAINDFTSRLAEIRHAKASDRPFVALLALNASEAQEQNLNAFLERQASMKTAVQVTSSFESEDGPDAAAQEIIEVCKKSQLWNPKYHSSLSMEFAESVSLKSACCTIL
mmetsp:Transcript_22022/g.39476  ORF Transcript_22022/g.39476 Transcript_22022/m.39476 type:complete len:364 (-) Transcript_22022:131-1222(-)